MLSFIFLLINSWEVSCNLFWSYLKSSLSAFFSTWSTISLKLAFWDRIYLTFLVYSYSKVTSILICFVASAFYRILLSIILSCKSNLLLTTFTTASYTVCTMLARAFWIYAIYFWVEEANSLKAFLLYWDKSSKFWSNFSRSFLNSFSCNYTVWFVSLRSFFSLSIYLLLIAT